MTKRRKLSDQFKAKVALEALRGNRTIQEIAAKHRVHPNQVSTWNKQTVGGLSGVFSGGAGKQGLSESEIKDLHAKIGRLALLGV
ncbi:MAG: transposase [Rhodobacteraceae bacterium]|nr:transposase [Paracoccaceae bacterium]